MEEKEWLRGNVDRITAKSRRDAIHAYEEIHETTARIRKEVEESTARIVNEARQPRKK